MAIRKNIFKSVVAQNQALDRINALTNQSQKTLEHMKEDLSTLKNMQQHRADLAREARSHKHLMRIMTIIQVLFLPIGTMSKVFLLHDI